MIADVSYSLSTAPGVWRRIIQNVPNVSCNADNSGFLNLSTMTGTLRTTSEKKSKKRDFGPISLDPYPPTINRDLSIRGIFYFIFPPTLLIKIGTFLKKKLCSKFIFNDYFDPFTGASNINSSFFDAA